MSEMIDARGGYENRTRIRSKWLRGGDAIRCDTQKGEGVRAQRRGPRGSKNDRRPEFTEWGNVNKVNPTTVAEGQKKGRREGPGGKRREGRGGKEKEGDDDGRRLRDLRA
jgi:hypothetical protein